MHAWNLIPALLIGLALTAPRASSAGSSALPAAATDSCGPSFLEIYDFRIGDVFQYSRLLVSNAGRGSFEAKYTVLSKEAFPDGFRYQVSGLTKTNRFPVMPDDGYGQTHETWEFRDSLARRSLDGCKNEIVRFPQSAPAMLSFGPNADWPRAWERCERSSTFWKARKPSD